mgnify:FL=1
MSSTTVAEGGRAAKPPRGRYAFDPSAHAERIAVVLREVAAAPETPSPAELQLLLRRFPRAWPCADDAARGGVYSKSELIRGARHLDADGGLERHGIALTLPELLVRLRRKPIRTLSGVAPVTVLTKPFPCPGKCIFCPSDVRMPKSYLSDEPGAQRAAEHQFDPYRQTLSRLLTLHNTGHRVDKVELIVLGGTWSFYPEAYQVWFIRRCFDALHDFAAGAREMQEGWSPAIDFRRLDQRVDGVRRGRGPTPEAPSYNRIVRAFDPGPRPGDQRRNGDGEPAVGAAADWEALAEAHRRNESSTVRCVGLVVETRPDRIDEAEVLRIRRLGATKVQIGFQSLDDEVLRLNRRGHDVAATRRAMGLLRAAGFKIHAHWMPNLYGSSPQRDLDDYRRMFGDPDFRPDELKIYPCSLIESAELMAYWQDGRWRPYSHDELLEVLRGCLEATPRYCRLTRVIRDIPGTDIVDGNKLTNFRQIAERDLERRGGRSLDIRARELRGERGQAEQLMLRRTEYEASHGAELFVEAVTADDRIAGFLRLQLPRRPDATWIDELKGSAMIREVHVYGAVVALGQRREGRAQHAGLGTRLVEEAAEVAARRGFARLAVISAIGTREWYRRLGFRDGELYMVRPLATDSWERR